MSFGTPSKRPALDFQAMAAEPEKERARCLCDIYAEVGFPFTARVVAKGADSPPGTFKEEVIVAQGTEVTFSATARACRLPPDGQDPIWILLGHK